MDPITAYLVRLGLPVQTAQQTAAKLLGPNPGAMLAATARREPSVTPLDPRADYRTVFGIDPPPGFTDRQIADAVDERVQQNVAKTDQNQRSGMTVTPLSPREDYRIVFGVDPPARATDRQVSDAADAQIQRNTFQPSKSYTPPKVATDKVTGPAVDTVSSILGLKNVSTAGDKASVALTDAVRDLVSPKSAKKRDSEDVEQNSKQDE